MTVYDCLIVVFLLCIAYHTYTDLKEMLLYDAVNAVLLVSGCIYAYFYGNIWQSMYGALLTGGVMMLLYILSRGGMGEGDVKLAFVLGVWLEPLLGVLGLLLASASGGILAVVLLVSGRRGRRDRLPFGPFICLGGVVAFFNGYRLLDFFFCCF